jgi:hypothetical protein
MSTKHGAKSMSTKHKARTKKLGSGLAANFAEREDGHRVLLLQKRKSLFQTERD